MSSHEIEYIQDRLAQARQLRKDQVYLLSSVEVADLTRNVSRDQGLQNLVDHRENINRIEVRIEQLERALTEISRNPDAKEVVAILRRV